MHLAHEHRRRLVPKVVQAIEAIPFAEGDWKRLGFATETDDYILSHERLLRSLRYGDDDYSGHAFTAVEHILNWSENAAKLMADPKIGKWMKEHAPDVYAEFADDGSEAVPAFRPSVSDRESVDLALRNAEVLLASQGAVSALDRVHTALHGYLLSACDRADIEYNEDPSLTDLFKRLRENHPALAPEQLGVRPEDTRRLLGAMATVVDVLNPLRNKGTLAHPNAALLDQPEAMLAINATRTLLHYLDPKLRASRKGGRRR